MRTVVNWKSPLSHLRRQLPLTTQVWLWDCRPVSARSPDCSGVARNLDFYVTSQIMKHGQPIHFFLCYIIKAHRWAQV